MSVTVGLSKFFRGTGKLLDQVGQLLEVHPYIEQLQPSTRVVKLGAYYPKIAANFIAPTASVIGNVTIGENSSLWYGAIARGDMKPIVIGKNTIIGDRVMLHVTGGDPGYPLTIGDRVVVKAGAIVHGCTLEDGCVVGEGAQVLDGAVVQKYAKVAAGSIVMKGKIVPTGQLWSGVPAKYQRDLSPEEMKQSDAVIKQSITLAIEHSKETSKSWEEIEDDQDRYYDKIYISDDLPKNDSNLDEFTQSKIQNHAFPGRIFNSNLRPSDKEDNY